ncbi:hypothetical protein RDI58_023073 [Solanum bulbocastanum]|uniref:N-acetyltransferase domain-containing protein n=1 Tax=Solanum bulbocastanum TaxID=147425 RepID=A0AAN8T6W1_SOLBU
MGSEELSMKFKEVLKLSNNEDVVVADDYSDSDISLRVLDLTGVDGFMEFYAYDNDSMSCDTFESKEDVVVADNYSDSDIISLRLLDLTDVDDFMECYADDNVSMFYSCDPFESKEDAMQYIADFIIAHPWTRAICLNGKVIGSVCVTPLDQEWFMCRAEIGYELTSKYWGKGIATKVVKMVASTIFVEWPHLARLEGVVDVENLASQRVLEKAGFTKEGIMRKYYLFDGEPRDMVMFSLLSTDPLDNLALDISRCGKSSCEERKNHSGRINFRDTKRNLEQNFGLFGTCLWIIWNKLIN